MPEHSLALSVSLLFSAGVAVAGISLISFLFGRQLFVDLTIYHEDNGRGASGFKAINSPLLLLCSAMGVLLSHAFALLSRAEDYRYTDGDTDQLQSEWPVVNLVAAGFVGGIIVDYFVLRDDIDTKGSSGKSGFSYTEIEMAMVPQAEDVEHHESSFRNRRTNSSSNMSMQSAAHDAALETTDCHSSGVGPGDVDSFGARRRHHMLQLLQSTVVVVSLVEVFVGFSAVSPVVLQSRALKRFCGIILSLIVRKAVVGLCLGNLLEFLAAATATATAMAAAAAAEEHPSLQPQQTFVKLMIVYSLSTSLGLLVMAGIMMLLTNGASDATFSNFDPEVNSQFFGSSGAPHRVSPPLPLWVDFLGFAVTACSSGILLFVVANLAPLIFSLDSDSDSGSSAHTNALQDLAPLVDSWRTTRGSSSSIGSIGSSDSTAAETMTLLAVRRRRAVRIGATLFGYFLLQVVELLAVA